MLPSVHRVLGVAPQRRQHLHRAQKANRTFGTTRYLPCSSARPSGIRNRNVSVPSSLTDATPAGIPPFHPGCPARKTRCCGHAIQPSLTAGIAIGLQVILLPPQLLGAEAQPHPAGRKVGFQPRQPELQVGPTAAASRAPAAIDTPVRPTPAFPHGSPDASGWCKS